MKKFVSLLLTLIITLSCAQAALAEEKPAVVDVIRLETENGDVLVVTYDARYAVPGEKPQVVLTFADGTEQTKTADEILHQVFEDNENNTVYPQLFIQCDETYPKCSVYVGEGAFVDGSGNPSPAVDIEADSFKWGHYDLFFHFRVNRNILTGKKYPLKESRVRAVLSIGDCAYEEIWLAASRLYLDDEAYDFKRDETSNQYYYFNPPAEAEESTVVARLNDFVWDDYTFVWFDKAKHGANELTLSERMSIYRKNVNDGLYGLAVSPLAFLVFGPLLLVCAMAYPLLSPFTLAWTLVLEGGSVAEGFDKFFEALFSKPPTERWEHDYADFVDYHH